MHHIYNCGYDGQAVKVLLQKDFFCSYSIGNDNYEQNFIDLILMYVITGDLSIIKPDDVQIIMNKEANLRLSHHLKPSRILDSLENDFDLFIHKWCKKENKNKESFQSWKNLIISRIRNKIYSNLKNSNTKSLFYNTKIKQAITNLQNEFVIVPVDKTNKNFAIICQKL